ncbi:MAG: calcium:proton exchanger [Candidatus Marinimicrobia bacterium CG08_land_8_20_14_0_20_45_22]|nr:MAG: calcium:proton exchanger [Candidatus Marinimicrobia bacterium CG08_land_8_20_14_0_20_45_22]
MFTIIMLQVIGVALLYIGAEGLVKGGSSVSLRWGLSPLFVGLTIVAFGTSAPELVVSIEAATDMHGAISIGNVLGSNIFNIAVILGLSALICPVKIHRQLVIIDMPILIGVSVLFFIIFLDFQVTRLEGLSLFLGIVGYTTFSLIYAKKQYQKGIEFIHEDDIPKPTRSVTMDFLFITGGLGALILGSHFFVKGAIGMARILSISEAVIGLTIVSVGTSLPELATSIVAAFRKETDIAVGNIVGSNIFNLLAIVGIASLVHPIDGTGIAMTDMFVMIMTAVLLLPLMRTGYTIKRLEGALLLLVYTGYLFYLWPK